MNAVTFLAGTVYGICITLAAVVMRGIARRRRNDKAEAEARRAAEQDEQARQVVEAAEQILRRRDA